MCVCVPQKDRLYIPRVTVILTVLLLWKDTLIKEIIYLGAY